MSYSLALRVSVVVLYAISFAAALVGNTLFLYIMYKKPYTRTTISFLFVNLAVADLVVTLIAMPDGTAFYFRNGEWPGGVEGDALCRLIRFSFALAIAASIFTLAAMTLDRFIAVVYPLKASKLRAPKVYTLVIWLSSTVLMSHRLLTYSTAENGDCISDWSLFQTDNRTGLIIWCVLYFALLFILPVIPMVVFYSIMCTKLYRQEIPGEIANVQVARRSRRDRNRKVVKLLISVVVVFILCWVPVQGMHFLWVLKKDTPPYVMFLCFWFGHSHSAINPWMYMYLNTQFRGAVLEVTGEGRNLSIRRNNTWKSSIISNRSRGTGDPAPVVLVTCETVL